MLIFYNVCRLNEQKFKYLTSIKCLGDDKNTTFSWPVAGSQRIQTQFLMYLSTKQHYMGPICDNLVACEMVC